MLVGIGVVAHQLPLGASHDACQPRREPVRAAAVRGASTTTRAPTRWWLRAPWGIDWVRSNGYEHDCRRGCDVPVGTTLVFPVVNPFTCVDPGAPGPGEEALRKQVAFVETSATDLTATMDGVRVRNVAASYEDSEVSSWRSGRQPVRRPGTYGFYVDAGYYIAVRSLPASERTIHFSGCFPAWRCMSPTTSRSCAGTDVVALGPRAVHARGSRVSLAAATSVRLAAPCEGGCAPASCRAAPLERVRSCCDRAAMHADLSMSYVECDIPAGLTMAEWRRARQAAERPRRRGLLRFWRRGA
jgi:hypothetical protein